jgi:hypothetical protein
LPDEDGEYEWEDDIEVRGNQEKPEGFRATETFIDRRDGYVRETVTEQATGRVICVVVYRPEVARIKAMQLTLNALKIEDEA